MDKLHMLAIFFLSVSSFSPVISDFSPNHANAVVAQDGTGTFTTIQQALDMARRRDGTQRFIIYIKRGVYQEYLTVGFDLPNITFLGDGMKNTIITGDRSSRYYKTIDTSTILVEGYGFIAKGITFRNTAGPQNGQAVALCSDSEHSVFYQCSFEGYQDTLLAFDRTQFYRECYIYGTIDFIFGNARVVFQNCIIYVRRPMTGQSNVITAQARDSSTELSGISIHKSRILAAPDLVPVLSEFKTFLGRPWRSYSRTVYLRCFLDNLIDPTGWTEWNGTYGLDTLYYGEHGNFGPGASTGGRVHWKGYRVINSSNEVAQFSVANFIEGQAWLPATGVPFEPDV